MLIRKKSAPRISVIIFGKMVVWEVVGGVCDGCDVVRCCVLCVVCCVSCIVCRVSCVVCRVLCFSPCLGRQKTGQRTDEMRHGEDCSSYTIGQRNCDVWRHTFQALGNDWSSCRCHQSLLHRLPSTARVFLIVLMHFSFRFGSCAQSVSPQCFHRACFSWKHIRSTNKWCRTSPSRECTNATLDLPCSSDHEFYKDPQSKVPHVPQFFLIIITTCRIHMSNAVHNFLDISCEG